MNKLLVSDSLEVNNNVYELDIKSKELVIDLLNKNKLYLINQCVEKIIINLKENSSLDIYIYNNKKSIKEIIINQDNLSNINFYYNFSNNIDSELSIINNITKDNNNSNIYVNNISYNGLSNISVLANINNKSTNNNIIESINGITIDGNISVLPDIICDSNEVIANHNTTIGCINKTLLNYLMSKGLSEVTSKKLILNGFINSNMDEIMKNKISENGGEKFE